MAHKILVPVDGSEHAKKAVDFALNMVSRFSSDIHLLYVVPETKIPEEVLQYLKNERRDETPALAYAHIIGEGVMKEALGLIREKGLRVTRSQIIQGDPAEEIIKYAKTHDMDMIIIGSRGLNQKTGTALGSVCHKVCQGTDSTTVIVRKNRLEGKRILIVDDEPDILETLEESLSMCKVTKAESFEKAEKLIEGQYFDMAILDIMGVNGFDLLKMTVAKNILTVMLTAHALSPETTIKAYKEGAASYIPKDKMADMTTFLIDVLEAKEEGKHFWWRWVERFGSYYNKRFGSDWFVPGKST